MSKTLLELTLALSAVCALAGCREDHRIAPTFQSARPPQSLEDALLYVSDADAGVRALTLDLATDQPKVIDHDLPPGPIQTYPMPGSDGRVVVVFTGGVESYEDAHHKRVPAQAATVLLYDRNGEVLRQPLSGRYQNLSLSDDGKYAIAWGASGNLVLQNAVEVVNLDLAKMQKAANQALTAATVMDLSFDGRAPAGFVFAPSTGFVRRLAVAPLANSLQVIDLDHPERSEISIKLSDTTSLTPTKVVFANDQFFVQNQSSAQILSFQIIAQADGTFQLAPSVLTTSKGSVEDLETVVSGQNLRLIALTNSLEVFDPNVGITATVDGVSSYSRLYKFSGKSPTDPNVSPRAALYGQGSAEIGFVDLGNETAWATSNVEVIELGDALQQLYPVPGTNLALVTHVTARVSLVDLEQRTVKRVLLSSSSQATLLDQDGSHSRLWIAGSDGTLGNIDLQTLLPTEVPLSLDFAPSPGGGDQPSPTLLGAQSSLVIVPGPVGGMRRRLAVLQNAQDGHVTLIDDENPAAQSALDVVGFFLAGLFD